MPQNKSLMKEYKYILMDLDGTITDPMEGITKSIAYALNHFDIKVNDLTELCPFIGPPLKDSFKEFYHFSNEQTDIAIKKYRERFSQVGVFENIIYSGIKEFLTKANKKGFKIFVATSKPTVFAKQILDYFSISDQFLFVGGSELDGNRQQKGDVIKYVLETNNIRDLSKTIMIGDRKYDIIGAKENNIDSMGVLYGYGSHEELTQAGADYIVATTNQLNDFLNSTGE